MSSSIIETLGSQLALLNEDEQHKVIAYIDSLLQEQRILSEKDLQRLQEFIGIGSGAVGDGAAEHNHYAYGLPKKVTR